MATETTAVGETNRKVTNTTSITKGSKKRENIKFSQPDIEASKPNIAVGVVCFISVTNGEKFQTTNLFEA